MPRSSRDISRPIRRNSEPDLGPVLRAVGEVMFERLPDCKGGYRFWGDLEGLLGFTAEELEGGVWEQRIHSEDRALYRNPPAPGGDGRPRRLEYRFRRKDGRTIWLRETRAAAGPGSLCHTGLLRKIDEERNHWIQFQHLQKKQLLGELAGVFAHDFNNLLTIFNGYTEILLEESLPGDPQHTYLEEMALAVERARELTTKLLHFGHLNPAPPGPTQIGPFVLDLCRILRRIVGENIEWDASILEETGWVATAPRQIETLCLNLVLNACAAMSEGGRLSLTLTPAVVRRGDRRAREGWTPGSYIRLSVTDTGVGIGEDCLEKIFDPFYTTKPPGCGSGLGLPVCARIAGESGGRITVESAPGKGSAFHVFLPRVKTPSLSKETALAVPPPRGQGELILLAEDNSAARQALAASLRQLGYGVICASQGKEALRLLKKEREIGLVISDWIMPLMGGVELAQRLRDQQSTMPILLISGYPTIPQELNDPFLQPIQYMTKPLSLSDLAHKLRELLDA